MDKASGVYLTITDNSIESDIGTAGLKVLIPMFTTKGELGLNTVTATNFKEILGYDVKWNSNYYGLQRILETVPYAKVWRLNRNAYIANAKFEGVGSQKTHIENAETLAQIQEEEAILVISNKQVGDWQTSAVKFTPTERTIITSNETPTEDSTQEIIIDDVTTTETMTMKAVNGATETTETVSKACVFYDSSDIEIVGCIVGTTVYPVFEGVIDKSKSIGTSSVSSNKLTVELTKGPSSDSFWVIHTLPSELKEWTFELAKYDRNYVVQNKVDFSTDTDSDIHYSKVDFGDIYIKFGTNDTWRNNTHIRDWQTLEGGNNGDTTISPIDLDISVLDKSECNMIACNGITDYKFVNRIAPKCKLNKIHIFADAPALDKFVDLDSQWASKVTPSEYVVIGARPDEVEYEDTIIYVYPSVNYISIYANMLNNQGSLNYPPAGASYGTISVEKLIDCDYEMYADELKTNRINWQRSTNRGTMMWEQRTTYALSSDLSYIAPVFILDELCANLKDFEENFNFRYMTPTDLITQESGLTSILDSYIDNSFLYSYKLNMPTYQEAQASGRTLNIPIEIVIMKDAEVININVKLNNA